MDRPKSNVSTSINPSLARYSPSRQHFQFLTTIIFLISVSQQAILRPNVPRAADGGPHCFPFVFVRPPTLNSHGRMNITENVRNGGYMANQNFAVGGLPGLSVDIHTFLPHTAEGVGTMDRVISMSLENAYSQEYTILLEAFNTGDDSSEAQPFSVHEITIPAAEHNPFGSDNPGRRSYCRLLQNGYFYRWALQVRRPGT